jgi:hypothetical protein
MAIEVEHNQICLDLWIQLLDLGEGFIDLVFIAPNDLDIKALNRKLLANFEPYPVRASSDDCPRVLLSILGVKVARAA